MEFQKNLRSYEKIAKRPLNDYTFMVKNNEEREKHTPEPTIP